MQRTGGVAVVLTLSIMTPALAQLPTTEQLPLPAGQTAAQTVAQNWQLTFNSEGRYTSATSSREGSRDIRNRTYYLPFGLEINGRPNDNVKVEFLTRSGYVDTRTSQGSAEAAFRGVLDTAVSLTTTYLGLNGIQPYVSINVNVPTGATVLRGSQAVTRPDSDIFGFAGFGEGWNIGPTIGVNIPISQNLIVAAGVGLTSRGAFDREGLNIGSAPSLGPIQHFNPGDVWTINSSAGYQEGAWSLQAAGSYSWETTTTVDGAAFYRTGQRYQLVGAVGYAWDSNWSSKLSSSFLHTRRNEVQLPLFAGGVLGLLMWEAFNTNSNVTTASFETTYRQGNFAIGPTVGFLYRDHNGYDSTRQEFLPAKTKWSVGGTGQYAVTDKVSFNARVEYIWATVNAEPQEINSQGVPISDTAIPPIYTRAWLVSLAGTAKF